MSSLIETAKEAITEARQPSKTELFELEHILRLNRTTSKLTNSVPSDIEKMAEVLELQNFDKKLIFAYFVNMVKGALG